LSTVTSSPAPKSLLDRIRSIVGKGLVAHSRSYREALATIAELRRVAAGSTDLDHAAAEQRVAELNGALTAMTAELRCTREQLEQTQDVLFKQQVDFGVIDHRTGEEIDRPADLPSILLVAPPKTGGAYIMTVLQRGLRLQRRWVTPGFFSPDVINGWRLDTFFKSGGCVAFHHTDASEINIWMLRQTSLKLLINVRDLRQCLISSIHYTLRHLPRPYSVLHPAEPPEAYGDWPFAAKLDWHIENQLPLYVDWITQWLRVVDAGILRAHISRYEDMVADQPAFFGAILDFYEIDRARFQFPTVDLDEKVNFRRGSIDEWRDVFSNAQKRRARQMIPERLMLRFGWRE